MRGAVVPMSDRTVTVKMVGPAALLAGRQEEFLAYCGDLEIRQVERLEADS